MGVEFIGELGCDEGILTFIVLLLVLAELAVDDPWHPSKYRHVKTSGINVIAFMVSTIWLELRRY